VVSHPPRPEQPRGGPGQSTAPFTPASATAGAGEQRPLLRVLAGTHGAHRREVADEVRRAGDQLQAPMGLALGRQAADEVQLVAFPPVAQGQVVSVPRRLMSIRVRLISGRQHDGGDSEGDGGLGGAGVAHQRPQQRGTVGGRASVG